MAKKKVPVKRQSEINPKSVFRTALKVGDMVMVIAGGNKTAPTKVLKGQTGKIKRFLPKKDRVVVEGLKMVKRHRRASAANESSGIIEKEGSIHISNVMFYSEQLKRPVRLKQQTLKDGTKVRGFINPKTKKFEQLDAA